MKRLSHRYIFIITIIALVLSACSDGSDNNLPPDDEGVITSTAVVFDTTLPDWINDAIVSVLSPSGERASNLEMPASTAGESGESFALAIDGDDNIVLASLVDSSSTVLSAGSTALVLVRLAIGPIPSGMTAAQLNAIIQSADEYANLVTLIEQALNGGIVPSLHPPVLLSVAQVTVQIEPAIGGAGIASADVAVIAAIADERVSLPDSIVIQDTVLSGQLPVQVTQGSFGQPQLVNNMPIPWTVRITDASGTAVDDPFVIDGILRSDNTKILSNSGNSFSATVGQDSTTRKLIMTEVITKTIQIALAALPSTCNATVLSASISAAIDAEFLEREVTLNEFVEYGRSLFSVANIVEILGECAPESVLAAFLKPVINYLSVLSKIEAAINAVTLAGVLTYAEKYWDESKTVGICVGPSPGPNPLFSNQLMNCTAEFRFDPDTLYTAVGVNIKNHVEIDAYDVYGDRTGIPADIEYVAHIGESFFDLDQTSGAMTTKEAGEALIGVIDPATLTTGTFDVKIVNPGVIEPNPIRIKVDETVTLSLTDGSGNPIVQAPGTLWGVDQPDVAAMNPLGVVFGFIEVIGRSPGHAVVSALNPVTGDAAVADIEVTDIDQRIAFHGSGFETRIYVMNADGSGITALSPYSTDPGHPYAYFNASSPAWSPDGTKIAFESGDQYSDIYVMDANGGNIIRLTDNSSSSLGSAHAPAWSPDGTKIAFHGSGFETRIYVMNADGSGITALSPYSTDPGHPYAYFNASSPAWSPDGTKIAFESGDQYSDIYVMDANGGNIIRLTDNSSSSLGSAHAPAWSPTQ